MCTERKLGNIYGSTGGNYAGNVYDVDYVAPVVTTCQGGNRQPMIVVGDRNMEFKIRKLTPIEVFKLMGFTKNDVGKCRKLGISDTQLYKQAGNSIVTNCVKLIAEHLYKAQYNHLYACYDERFKGENT